jgi:hypothetical protein
VTKAAKIGLSSRPVNNSARLRLELLSNLVYGLAAKISGSGNHY